MQNASPKPENIIWKHTFQASPQLNFHWTVTKISGKILYTTQKTLATSQHLAPARVVYLELTPKPKKIDGNGLGPLPYVYVLER